MPSKQKVSQNKTNECACGKTIALKYMQCYQCKKKADAWVNDFTYQQYKIANRVN